MFDSFYSDLSYIGLFIVSFLSSTFLPLASEAFTVAFVRSDFDPTLVLLTATLANALGNLSVCALAYFDEEKILQKYFASSLKRLENCTLNFYKLGWLFAFLNFLSLIRDLFALGLGFAKYPLIKTAFFIALGKLSRYFFLVSLNS